MPDEPQPDKKEIEKSEEPGQSEIRVKKSKKRKKDKSDRQGRDASPLAGASSSLAEPGPSDSAEKTKKRKKSKKSTVDPGNIVMRMLEGNSSEQSQPEEKSKGKPTIKIIHIYFSISNSILQHLMNVFPSSKCLN